MLKKLWNDPVWSKVIAAAIIALAGGAWLAHWQNWWTPIGHAIGRVADPFASLAHFLLLDP
jgi:hypothetical protein